MCTRPTPAHELHAPPVCQATLMDPEDEQVLELIRASQPEAADECDEAWAPLASFGPRCHRCGNPCGDDVVYHGSLAFHRCHFTCRRCRSALRVPISVNGDVYCQSCAPHVEPGSHVCCVCQQPRNSESIVVAGRCFCPQHFTCRACGVVLDPETFGQRGGEFFCPEHVPDMAVCAACGMEVNSRRVIANGCSYHADCFCCSMCGTNLVDQKYTTYDGRPICVRCFKGLPKGVQAGIARSARYV